MLKKMPNYYKSSRIMQQIISSIKSECDRLKAETTLTENQFFVMLSSRNLAEHERDVGLIPDATSDVETRRGRILARLRGSGTVTKTMVKNVAASFVNGEIEITEYASQYLFAVKFNSKRGVPYNLADIQAMIEDIKPAHLAVEYIFTYRLWEDVRSFLAGWNEVNTHTWDWLLTFEVMKNINIANGALFFCPDDNGNGTVIWSGTRAYAREEL